MRVLLFGAIAMSFLFSGCANSHSYLEDAYQKHQTNSAVEECFESNFEMCRPLYYDGQRIQLLDK